MPLTLADRTRLACCVRPQARHGFALAIAGYFLAAIAIGLLAAPMAPALTWDMSAAQVMRDAPYNDPISFLKGAVDIAHYGWVTPPNYWLVHLWPPGFMVLEGGLLRVLGDDAPILVLLLAASAACCAGWMALLREYLLPRLPRPLANLIPLVPFAFPITPFFLLSPLGLSFGETFAISFYLGAFLLLLIAHRRGSWWQAAGAGVLLALSAYFRSQFEMLVSFLVAAWVLLLLLSGLAWVRRRKMPIAPRSLLLMLVAAGTAQAAMLPWRIHNKLDTGTFAWVHTPELIARNALATDRTLRRADGEFVIRGGGNLACRLERSYCGQSDPALLYRAFFHHLGPWLAAKARLVPEYWTAPPHAESLGAVVMPPTPSEILVNLALLAALLAGLWRLWQIRREPEFALQAWFQLSLYACLAGVYTMVHFEARYLYLPKIFSLVALLTLLPVHGSSRSEAEGVRA